MPRATTKAKAIAAGSAALRPVQAKPRVVSRKSVIPHDARMPSVHPFILCVVLGLATATIYSSVVKYEFIDYDDDTYVSNNQHVSAGLNWQTIQWAITTDAAGNWHPLTWISHALDCQLYGLDHPGGHHATNLLLHVLNVLLLFLFLSLVTGATWRGFMVAALFALHPFNVESVAWIAERKNVLCTLFFLLALLAYAWYSRKPGIRRYLCVLSLLALGLVSKPMVVTLPFVLLLLDFWPLGRVQDWSEASAAFPVPQMRFQRLLLEKTPLLALSAASSIITMIAQRHGKAVVSFSDSALSWRLENAAWAYATYFWKAFFPWHLAPFYPTMFLSVWQFVLPGILLLALGGLVLKFGSRRQYLPIGYLWFVGTLVPVIGIVQIGAQSMADRYAYIPLIGIFIAVVWGTTAVARSIGLDKKWLVTAAAVCLTALALTTLRQVSYWKNSVDLWTHASQVTVKNFVAEEDLGVGLANQGRSDEALPHFITAAQIRPTDPVARLNIGINLEAHGRHQAAIQQFEIVVRTNPDAVHLSEAHRRIGVIYAQIGDRARARTNLLEALRLTPDDPVVIQNLEMVEVEDAVEKMTKVVSAHPTALGYLQLGRLLEDDRNLPEAQNAYENALRLEPHFAEAANALTAMRNASKQN